MAALLGKSGRIPGGAQDSGDETATREGGAGSFGAAWGDCVESPRGGASPGDALPTLRVEPATPSGGAVQKPAQDALEKDVLAFMEKCGRTPQQYRPEKKKGNDELCRERALAQRVAKARESGWTAPECADALGKGWMRS